MYRSACSTGLRAFDRDVAPEPVAIAEGMSRIIQGREQTAAAARARAVGGSIFPTGLHATKRYFVRWWKGWNEGVWHLAGERAARSVALSAGSASGFYSKGCSRGTDVRQGLARLFAVQDALEQVVNERHGLRPRRPPQAQAHALS